MKTITIISLAALSALALGQTKTAPKKMGVQKATIVVDNGFKPATVSVKAGRPVQLTFDTKHRGCATSVVFEGLKMSKPLTDGKKTIVTFTPKRAGTIAYACPMKMMTGSVVAK